MYICRLLFMHRFIITMIPLVLVMFSFPAIGIAREIRSGGFEPEPKSAWSVSLSNGSIAQFDSDIDDGGSFGVNRLAFQGGLNYAPDYRRSFTLALGYDLNDYEFSGDEGFAALRPWKDVSSYRVSMPVRWAFNDKWSGFVAPSLRFVTENGAELRDSISGGGITGISYRWSERLMIGPGIGVMTQIEDNPSIFPIMLVKWKITDRLNVSTGPGLGATLGPGLFLNWKASQKWNVFLGGRFERLRFRLDDDGTARQGIGDDRAYPITGGVVYNLTRRIQAGLIGGVDLGGELRLEDKNGDKIFSERYDPAGYIGFTIKSRF